MFDAPYCTSCGEKEHSNGYGCNNPKCTKYYKIKAITSKLSEDKMEKVKQVMISCSYEHYEIDYTNHRGETATRKISPVSLCFGESKYHNGRRLILNAIDIDKMQYREFSFDDIHAWRELKAPETQQTTTHLCSTCLVNKVPECIPTTIKFASDTNDSIISCQNYRDALV